MLQHGAQLSQSKRQITRFASSRLIRAILPVLRQNEIKDMAFFMYLYQKHTLLTLTLPYVTNIRALLGEIFYGCESHHHTYDNMKILIHYDAPHRYLSNTLTAQFLNDGYDIQNNFTREWQNIRQARQRKVADIINQFPIKYYDENISTIITSYIPYEYVPSTTKKKKSRLSERRRRRRKQRYH
jgi:hypothetical protein